MIIYPNQDIPRTLTLEEASAIFIRGEYIPVSALSIRLVELELSPSLERLFALHDMEFLGECDQSMVDKIGFGVQSLREVSQILKKAIYEHITTVVNNSFVLTAR